MLRLRSLFIAVLISLTPGLVWAQNSSDSLENATPFRKGRWLTGLSGAISSGFNNLDTAQTSLNRNQYAIDFQTGQFIKDRLLIGGIVSLSRGNSEEFFDRTLEQLFIGPLATWYVSESEQGSIFINGGAGYTRFRDESEFLQGGTPSYISIKGNGIGILVRLGYSYVLHDRVGFDLGLNYNQSWLRADVIEQPIDSRETRSFTVGDISFSFGFNVLLDGFFF